MWGLDLCLMAQVAQETQGKKDVWGEANEDIERNSKTTCATRGTCESEIGGGFQAGSGNQSA